ncbi:hypothetical protein [Staphylococcus hominis]|uniref:hypothetical protein n=1 Tax=Staphylococcus hominis TaxID=1290 RepID=UPI001472FB79|nr:hypothetical protein [Staphylococcus hominis]NMD91146.1 hypothetical protein [Staphylococcus hominis]
MSDENECIYTSVINSLDELIDKEYSNLDSGKFLKQLIQDEKLTSKQKVKVLRDLKVVIQRAETRAIILGGTINDNFTN